MRFWRSETVKVWIQYLVVAIALVPFAIWYVNEQKLFWPSMVIAVICGLVVWKVVGRLLQPKLAKEVGSCQEIHNRIVQISYSPQESIGSDIVPISLLVQQYGTSQAAFSTNTASLR